MPYKNILYSVYEYLKNAFLRGLLILIPICFTVWVFTYSFHLLKRFVAPIHAFVPEAFRAIPQSEIILVIIVIFLLGILLKSFVLEPLIEKIESIFFKIPLMNPIYSGIKQLVHAFTFQDKDSFQKIVLVEFPRKGIYSIGFVTKTFPVDHLRDGKTYTSVFIPTTPNPTSGFLIIVPEEEITTIDLNRQEAMGLIISGGIIQPDRFTKNNPL